MSATAEERRARALPWLLAATAGYVATSLMANVMSVRVVQLFGFSVDAGTLTYPLTFTLRDVIHKVGGRGAARLVIVVTAGLNVVLALGLWVAARLPADLAVGPQEEFGELLSPVLRITAASIIAQVLAELIDTEVYHRYVRRFGARHQYGRVLASNAVSVPVDSVVFVLVAFAGADGFTAGVLVEIIWANIAIKGATSLLTFPLIYAVPDLALEEPPSEPVASSP